MERRIEVRDAATGKVLMEQATSTVVSVSNVGSGHPADKFFFGGGPDGRTFAVIPTTHRIVDVTINLPGDLVMVVVTPRES